MEVDFEVNQRVQIRNQGELKRGQIVTIYTNKQPIIYVVRTDDDRRILCTGDDLSNEKQQQLDFQFQQILQLLIIQKNEDICIKNLMNILQYQQVEKQDNIGKILVALYEILNLRKPSIQRHHPFIEINKVLKKIRRLIFKIKNNVLEQCFQDRVLKRRKISFIEDSEKEDHTAVLEEPKTNKISGFQPYKVTEKQQVEQITKIPKILFFKPIVVQGLQNLVLQ